MHHSFVRLPGPGFHPRRFDPRIGGFSTQVVDFGQPLGSHQGVAFGVADIAATAATDPGSLKAAPLTTPVGRLDEAGAARHPDLRHSFATAAGPDEPG